MKDKKSIIIACLIVLLIKVGGSLLTNSYTLMSTAILEGILLIYFLLSLKKESKKGFGIITALLGLIVILLSLGLLLLCLLREPTKPSFFLILFVIVCVLTKYAVTSLKVNSTYNKRIGLLAVSNIKSNLEFYTYGVVLGSLILSKLGRFLKVLRYADKLGTFLIVGVIIYYGIRLIANSVRYMEDKGKGLPEEFLAEITKREEVRRLETIAIRSFGGLRTATVNVELKETMQLVDINTFAVTLEDYLLKVSDVVEVNMTNGNKITNTKKNKPKVVSKKAEIIKNTKNKKNNKQANNKKPQNKGSKNNARNSGSRNGKTSSKKKNNKKNNKKR